MKFNTKALALASGLIYGFILFVTVWWLIARGYSGQETLLSMIYPYLNISPPGSLLGLIYGFVDGAILGALFAWLYNILCKAYDRTEGEGNGQV